jgi:general secretion pathway protein D
VFTQGLRNEAPELMTITGILTDPQFRVVIHALEQREGIDLLSAPRVTTASGRQTQVKAVDVQTIITDLDQSQTSAGTTGTAATIGGTTGGGAVGSQVQYVTQQFEFGPTLDVIPHVSADGFTIQMVVMPTLLQFIGYDDPGPFIAQIQSVSGNTVAGTIASPTPLPRFRLRQLATSVAVWDGQTAVLGGLISEDVDKMRDKVPIIGDLPLIGRLFRSEASKTQKKNLVIFVTPTLIDPAGNRLHSLEDMPFAMTGVPSQVSSVTQTGKSPTLGLGAK